MLNPNLIKSRNYLLIAIGFTIPISTVLTNIFCGLVVLLTILEGNYQTRWQQLYRCPISRLAWSLFAYMIIAFSYTSASWKEALLMLDKYRELLYIPIFILLFQQENLRKWGLNAFLAAMGLTLSLSYLTAITGWELGKGPADNPFVFKNYITQGLLMSLAAYFLAVHVWQHSQNRWWRTVLILLALYNIIFMTQGRTGYIVLACLVLLFIYQVSHWRGVLLGLLSLVVISLGIYQLSDVVQTRIDKVSLGLQDYQQGEIVGSIPARLQFLHNSFELVTQHPVFGTGTGSFAHQYRQLSESQGTLSTDNPHNEYLMLAVQWGLLGMSLFIYLLWQLANTSRHLSQPWLAQGLLMAMAVGCVFNSLLLDTTEGHLFAYLIGLFWAQRVSIDSFYLKGTS